MSLLSCGGAVCRVEHILGNLVMQLLLGIPLELVHKGFEVGMVYLAGVLAGEPSSTPALHRLYTCCTPAVHLISAPPHREAPPRPPASQAL